MVSGSAFALPERSEVRRISIDFYNGTFNSCINDALILDVPTHLVQKDVNHFYKTLSAGDYKPLTDSLIAYRNHYQLNDWLYYQLVRKVAEQLSPKGQNYSAYTLYKWFLMTETGYDARVALSRDKVIFYVLNNEDITDIPAFVVDGKKYMCLNYHDYPGTDINQDPPVPVAVSVPGATRSFSYKVTRMPDFKPEDYREKDLEFTYRHKPYFFKIKLNPEVGKIFMNYPGVDFETYFNIPLSKETYGSLIPLLRKNVQGMTTVNGVDYLMHFTRYAFLYESDDDNYGREKRLSPELTLSAKYSDCDDRAALFFYVVKEIYNLPMIAILYPTHITMAVQFDKVIGTPVMYNGKAFSVCEPTPQQQDLRIGQLSAHLKNEPFRVVFAYEPHN